MCVVSVPHAHGFQTIPHKNSCRAVCAEMFQNLKLWSSGNILVTISFQIKTDEFCPLLTQRWNTQLWKCRQLPRVYAVPWPDPLALVSAFGPNNLKDSCCFKCNFKKSLIIYEPNSLLKWYYDQIFTPWFFRFII